MAFFTNYYVTADTYIDTCRIHQRIIRFGYESLFQQFDQISIAQNSHPTFSA